MFEFETRDDGFFVRDETGRGVAHVITRKIEEGKNPNHIKQEVKKTDLAQPDWIIHFTGAKLTFNQATALMDEIANHTPSEE